MSDKKNVDYDYDDPRYRTTPVQQMGAACTGALITSLFVTPLDVVKIRLQAQQQTKAKCFLYCNGLMDHFCPCTNPNDWSRRPGKFNGTIDAFIKISRTEGILSLWSGLSPTLVLAVPTTVLYFVTYEQLRSHIKDWYNEKKNNIIKEQPYWIPLVSGATARVIAATTVSPMELIRTKMQSERLSYMQIGNVLKRLIHANGVTSLWKGIVPTLLRDVPFSAIYWLSYEKIKSLCAVTAPNFGISFMAGAVSGALAASVTIPFDVVKTHQQIDLGEHEILSDKPYKSKTTLTVMKEIQQIHGVKGLFTGLIPRLIKVAPACAVMIATFEYSKQVFNQHAFSKQNKTKEITTTIVPNINSTYE